MRAAMREGARWALDQAISYVKVRKTFGRPIAEHQAIQFMLAESAMAIYAAKSMANNCAERVDAGQPAIKEISMTKAFCTEMPGQVMVHGATGPSASTRFTTNPRFRKCAISAASESYSHM